MSEREWFLFVKDMSQSLERIIEYTEGMNQKEFIRDQKTYDAVMRNLEIIGEAVKHIPNDIKKKYRQIEWVKLASLRNIVIHDYFGVDEDIIWDIVQNKVADLKDKLVQIKAT